jgi:hypothetical protein
MYFLNPTRLTVKLSNKLSTRVAADDPAPLQPEAVVFRKATASGITRSTSLKAPK